MYVIEENRYFYIDLLLGYYIYIGYIRRIYATYILGKCYNQIHFISYKHHIQVFTLINEGSHLI